MGNKRVNTVKKQSQAPDPFWASLGSRLKQRVKKMDIYTLVNVIRVLVFLYVLRTFFIMYMLQGLDPWLLPRLLHLGHPQFHAASKNGTWNLEIRVVYHPDAHHLFRGASARQLKRGLEPGVVHVEPVSMIYSLSTTRPGFPEVFMASVLRSPVYAPPEYVKWKGCNRTELDSALTTMVVEMDSYSLRLFNTPRCDFVLHLIFPLKYLGPWTVYNVSDLVIVAPGDSPKMINLNLVGHGYNSITEFGPDAFPYMTKWVGQDTHPIPASLFRFIKIPYFLVMSVAATFDYAAYQLVSAGCMWFNYGCDDLMTMGLY